MAESVSLSSKGTNQVHMSGGHDRTSWYAVSTRSRHEKVAASLLIDRGVSCFLPLLCVTRQWSDRRQNIEQPLFPGYLFVQIPMLSELRTRVLSVPGIVKFIGNGGPQAIPDAQMDGVRELLSRGAECTSYPMLSVGDRVRVTKGVLKGIEGTLMRIGGDSKLVLCVEMIQRSIAVTIRSSDVELLEGSAACFELSA